MKIGILTQPLHDNYGGLLQAYALKTTLEKIGHDVDIINRRKDDASFKFRLRKIVKKILGKGPKFELTKLQKEAISQHTSYFAKTYIKDITPPIYDTEALRKIAPGYEGFVIGSDQVWRPAYSPKIANYYLDFVDNPNVKGVAYAASFGVDHWEYSEEQTKECKANVHKIKAVSVREDSAVELCRKHLGVEAVHVLDPTMLLNKEEYIELIKIENEKQVDGGLMHYVLDKNEEKEALIQRVAQVYNYKPFTAHQKKKPTKESVQNIEDFVFPKVTTWLNGFHSAEFIVTDSFHGTVFSILFNKPFLVIANMGRGKARFDSLLKMFHLEDRLVTDSKSIDQEKIKNLKPINWEAVNAILAEKKQFAFNFLKSNLN